MTQLLLFELTSGAINIPSTLQLNWFFSLRPALFCPNMLRHCVETYAVVMISSLVLRISRTGPWYLEKEFSNICVRYANKTMWSHHYMKMITAQDSFMNLLT